MKKFLKNWFINSSSLAIIGWLFPGVEVSTEVYDFLLASFVFTILVKIVRPVYDLAFFPLHMMTLGMFRWINAVISFGITIYLVKTIELKGFYFPGVNFGEIEIQSFISPLFLSLIIGAILLNLCKKIIRWVVKTK